MTVGDDNDDANSNKSPPINRDHLPPNVDPHVNPHTDPRVNPFITKPRFEHDPPDGPGSDRDGMRKKEEEEEAERTSGGRSTIQVYPGSGGGGLHPVRILNQGDIGYQNGDTVPHTANNNNDADLNGRGNSPLNLAGGHDMDGKRSNI